MQVGPAVDYSMAPMIDIMSMASSASTTAKATLSISSASSPVVNHNSSSLQNLQPALPPNANYVPPPVSITVSNTNTNSTGNMAKRRRLECSEDGVVQGIDRGPSASTSNATHNTVAFHMGPALAIAAAAGSGSNSAPLASDSDRDRDRDMLTVPINRLHRKWSSSSSTNNAAERDGAPGGTGSGALSQPLAHCPLVNNIKTERLDSLTAAERRQHSESASSAAAAFNAAIDSDHKGLLDSDDEDDPYERRKRELLDGKCLLQFHFYSNLHLLSSILQGFPSENSFCSFP